MLWKSGRRGAVKFAPRTEWGMRNLGNVRGPWEARIMFYPGNPEHWQLQVIPGQGPSGRSEGMPKPLGGH